MRLWVTKESWGTSLTLVVVLLMLFSSSAQGLAQPAKDSRGESPTKDKKVSKAEAADDGDFPPVDDSPGVRKTYSAATVRTFCAQYEGQMIAFYDDIFKVEHCKRRRLLDNKTVYHLQREGHKVRDVTADVIAAIPEGEAFDEATSAKYARSCKQLEGQYVTFSNVDVYFIEKCKKRLFPDWTTYIKHREQRNNKKGEILSLSWWEFDRLEAGTDIASIVDDMFAKLLTGAAQVEVIPINEACEGLEGKIASYYSHVYKIERCHKRDIEEADRYLKKLGVNKVRIVEMKSEQWLSLPSGAPIREKPVQYGERPTELHPH